MTTEDQQGPESYHTEKVVAEYFALGQHIFSTRTADAYKAVDQSNNASVVIWLLRQSLGVGTPAVEAFLDRIRSIDEIQPSVSDTAAYGVDAEGRGFALFPPLDGYSVVSGNIELPEAERRFLGAVKIVQQLHENGILCGDLCGNSFWMNRSGAIRFFGVMGSFEGDLSGTSMAPPIDTIPYFAPEQRVGGTVEAATDVFALGVLGYYLITRHYPFGDGEKALSPKGEMVPLSTHIGVPPIWAPEVIERCLQKSPADRYANAGEVAAAMSAARQRAASDASVPAIKSKAGPLISTKKSEDGRVSSFQKDQSPAKKTEQESQKPRLLAFILMGGLVIALSYGVVTLLFTGGGSEEVSPLEQELQPHLAVVDDENLREAIDKVGVDSGNIDERMSELKTIGESEDPIAHDVLIKSAREGGSPALRAQAEKVLLDRSRRLGIRRATAQIDQWLRTLRPDEFPASYEPLLKSVHPSVPTEARFSLLRQAYARNPQVALRVAAGLALDLDAVEEFQPLLAQLVGDSLGLKGASSRGTYSLILAHPDLTLAYGEDALRSKGELSDEDILWLIELLASRGDINVRALSNIALDRGLLPPIQESFLVTLRDRADLPASVAQTISNAANGLLSEDDIRALGDWYDIQAEPILLSILATTEKEPVAEKALEVLTGKSPSVEPSASLLKWVRETNWDKRAEFARLIGLLGNLEHVEQAELEAAFDELESVVRDSDMLDILLDADEPTVNAALLKKYGDLFSLGTLLTMLTNKDPEVRILAVRGLKDFNDLGALKIIIDNFEREENEEVREVYRDTFWVIRKREEQGSL